MRNGEAMGKGSGIRRLRRRIRHLPKWSKASALALVGCETSADAPEGMETQTIAAGRYAKIAIRGGDCVASVAKAWEEIWADEELTAKRAYTVDFEAYLPGEDMSCADIDVYVALR